MLTVIVMIYNLYFYCYLENKAENETCKVITDVQLLITVICQCEKGNHFQVLLQSGNSLERAMNITTARGFCLNAVKFQVQDIGRYHVTAFIGMANNTIGHAMIYFSKDVELNDEHTTVTTPDMVRIHGTINTGIIIQLI